MRHAYEDRILADALDLAPRNKQILRFTKAKEKYKAEHEGELRRFYMLKRKLKEKGFENITTLEIPITVTSIEEYAFRHCNSLNSISVTEGNSKYYVESQGALIETTSSISSNSIPSRKSATLAVSSTVSSLSFVSKYLNSMLFLIAKISGYNLTKKLKKYEQILCTNKKFFTNV